MPAKSCKNGYFWKQAARGFPKWGRKCINLGMMWIVEGIAIRGKLELLLSWLSRKSQKLHQNAVPREELKKKHKCLIKKTKNSIEKLFFFLPCEQGFLVWMCFILLCNNGTREKSVSFRFSVLHQIPRVLFPFLARDYSPLLLLRDEMRESAFKNTCKFFF